MHRRIHLDVELLHLCAGRSTFALAGRRPLISDPHRKMQRKMGVAMVVGGKDAEEKIVAVQPTLIGTHTLK